MINDKLSPAESRAFRTPAKKSKPRSRNTRENTVSPILKNKYLNTWKFTPGGVSCFSDSDEEEQTAE